MSHLGERAADHKQDRSLAGLPTGPAGASACCEALRGAQGEDVDLK